VSLAATAAMSAPGRVPARPATDPNRVLGPTSPVPAAADEAAVLFAGRRQVDVGFYGVNAFMTPWNPAMQPPDPGYYGVNTWHGGWKWKATEDSAEGRMIPELSRTETFFRGSPGTMLQFALRNHRKAGGWTDADYDFEDLDRWIGFYRAQGRQVVYNWYVNIWEDALQAFGVTVPRVSVARFRDALERVARRHGDAIRYWEGPNEPDSVHRGDWNWYNAVGRMSLQQFAQTYRIAAQVLRAAKPGAQVTGPHFSTLSPHGVQAVEAALKTRADGGPDAGFGTGAGTRLADWIDVVGNHGYLSRSPDDLQAFIDGYRGLLQAMRRAGAADKPHYISEWMAFDGDHPKQVRSTAGIDAWRWFERQAVAVAFDARLFSHFTWSQPGDYYGDARLESVRARRAWWQSVVGFMTGAPIARIAKTRDGGIRVTREDGQALQTRGELPADRKALPGSVEPVPAAASRTAPR
jgi:hypothetical protein